MVCGVICLVVLNVNALTTPILRMVLQWRMAQDRGPTCFGKRGTDESIKSVNSGGDCDGK